MKYSIKETDPNRFQEVYSIHDNVYLRMPSPKYTPCCALRRYIMLYLECFKMGVKLPL